jgi:hypothetical protein
MPRLVPSNPWLTVALLALLVGLALYMIVIGDVIGYVLLGLLVVFVGLPSLVLVAGNRRLPRAVDAAEPPDIFDEDTGNVTDRGEPLDASDGR